MLLHRSGGTRSITIGYTGNKGETVQPSNKQSTRSRVKVEANALRVPAESTVQSFLVSVRAEITAESQLGALDILQVQSLPVP